MWLIEVTKNGVKESHLWHNKHTDDFARFIPDNFGVSESDCKFYHITKVDCDTHCNLINQLTGEEGAETAVHYVDNSELGKLKVKQVSDDSLVHTLTGDPKLWSQMYNDEMQFILV